MNTRKRNNSSLSPRLAHMHGYDRADESTKLHLDPGLQLLPIQGRSLSRPPLEDWPGRLAGWHCCAGLPWAQSRQSTRQDDQTTLVGMRRRHAWSN